MRRNHPPFPWAAASLLAACLAASGSEAADATYSAVLREQVDLIELNHFFDDRGRHVFDQVIFYQWSSQQGRFLVKAWRMVKSDSQRPIRRFDPPRYECLWHDSRMLRQVTAPAFRETWTNRDPERTNRRYLAEAFRVGLARPHLPPPLESEPPVRTAVREEANRR